MIYVSLESVSNVPNLDGERLFLHDSRYKVLARS